MYTTGLLMMFHESLKARGSRLRGKSINLSTEVLPLWLIDSHRDKNFAYLMKKGNIRVIIQTSSIRVKVRLVIGYL